MKTALVLAGGGSNGSFEVGAVTRLVELGVKFDCIAGVSVGSLNGALIAQGDLDVLTQVWQEIETSDVYHKFSNLRVAIRLLACGKRSMYDSTPLRELIRKYISLDRSNTKFYIGLTGLRTGNYHSLTQTDFEDNESYGDAIYASSLMPILWEPINVKTKNLVIKDAVDGGLRNVTPLSDIIDEMPDKIYIITCHPGVTDPANPKNIVEVAKRTFMDIMLTEIVDSDVRGLLFMNELVRQANLVGLTLMHPKENRPLKYFEVEFIKPPHRLGDSTKFDHPRLDNNFKLGYDSVGR